MIMNNPMCRICGNDITDNTVLTVCDSPYMCLGCYAACVNYYNCPLSPEDIESFCSVFPQEIDGYYLHKFVCVNRTDYGNWVAQFTVNAISNWKQSPNQRFGVSYALSEQADEEFREQYPEHYEEMKKFRTDEFIRNLRELLTSNIIPFINEQRKNREELSL